MKSQAATLTMSYQRHTLHLLVSSNLVTSVIIKTSATP